MVSSKRTNTRCRMFFHLSCHHGHNGNAIAFETALNVIRSTRMSRRCDAAGKYCLSNNDPIRLNSLLYCIRVYRTLDPEDRSPAKSGMMLVDWILDILYNHFSSCTRLEIPAASTCRGVVNE